MVSSPRPARSRRDFLAVAAGAGTASLLAPPWLRAVAQVAQSPAEPVSIHPLDHPVDPRVAQVLARTVSIDMHSHVYPEGTSENGAAAQAEPLDLAMELQRSGLTAVCASFVLDHAPNKKPGDARTNYLHWLDAMRATMAKDNVRRALSLRDLQTAHRLDQATIVLSVEGAMFLEGELSRVGEVYRLGARHLQLLHEQEDLVAPLGDMNTGDGRHNGLTAFGIQVVAECNRLGMLIDMAHGSANTVRDVLKTSSDPIVISHTSLLSRPYRDAKMYAQMKPRLISAQDAKLVADADGVVGVWTHLADSLPDFVESLKAMADAIGVDHVGIGSDTDLLAPQHGMNTAYPNLTDGFFPAVVGEMLKQGFTVEEIDKIGGGNYCRVFGAATEGGATQ